MTNDATRAHTLAVRACSGGLSSLEPRWPLLQVKSSKGRSWPSETSAASLA